MNPGIIVLLMFVLVVILFILRTPVAFTLGFVGVLFLYVMRGSRAIRILPPGMLENMTSIILLAIPLFVFIGCMLEKQVLLTKSSI